MGNRLTGSVKPISEEFIRESTTPRTDVYGQSYTYLRNNQNGANHATSDSYFAQHFRNKHYNTLPGEGPGGTSYSGIMGNNQYFINRGDNGKYMYNIRKEDGTIESGEDLTSMPSHVKTWIRDTYNSHAQKYPGSRDVFDNMYSNETSSHQEGGQIKPNIIQRLEDRKKFHNFRMTLPPNLRPLSRDYNMRRYWELWGKPDGFYEALTERDGMFSYENDGVFHANTVGPENEKGEGEFMKSRNHRSLYYETDWYNKGITYDNNGKPIPLQGQERKDWEDFRNRYDLDTSRRFYKYVPRK